MAKRERQPVGDDVASGAARKGSRITGDERDRLAADLRQKYDAGQSIRTLAAGSGLSYGSVHRMLSESGATLRGGGGKRVTSPVAGTQWDDLVRRGVIEPPQAPKQTLPEPVRARGGLSDLVIADRG